MGAELQGEPLYESTGNFTQVVEFGVSMEALASGQVAPPPEGARFDVWFEGAVKGTKPSGSLKGVDHLHVRADGRFQLHIHAEITADDGSTIALAGDGVATGAPPVLSLRENVTLTTSAPKHSWVNTIQGWGTGTVDAMTGALRIAAYEA